MEEALSLRERKKIETRRRILHTAIELFQERGFEQTLIDEIASRAEISRGTFFNYFPNKEGVLREIALDELRELGRLIEVEQAEQGSVIEKIRQVMRRLVADTLPYLRIMRDVLLREMLYPSGETAISMHLSDMLLDLVVRAQAKGEIRADLNAQEVAYVLLGPYLSVVFAQIARQSTVSEAQETVEHALDMILTGIVGKG